MALRLASRRGGGVLGAMTVTQPQLVGAAQASGVVLQLQQVQAGGREEDQVDLGSGAPVVTELEVRPGAVRGTARQEIADDLQALGLMGELRRRDLDPTVVHHAVTPLRGDGPHPIREPAAGEMDSSLGGRVRAETPGGTEPARTTVHNRLLKEGNEYVPEPDRRTTIPAVRSRV